MLIRRAATLKYSDVTPLRAYLNRREFLLGLGSTGLALGAGLGEIRKDPHPPEDKITPKNDVLGYNNFYEFGTGKKDPAKNAGKLKTSPWTVSVEGAIAKPHKYDLAELMKVAPLEERIYRHRCVERWSMVVPWVGFSLSQLIKQVEPTAKAKYIEFESVYSRLTMLSAGEAGINFPYVEGLRMDEAMNPLALLCFGMYGDPLPNQDGAPVRMVLPWKYGYKSIKSIVKIRFVGSEPYTTWNIANPSEYGFYSNVNPQIRSYQKSERRLGEFSMRETRIFNGYADQVSSLYSGMDLKKHY